MMLPVVPPPEGGKIKRTIDVKLKPGWSFDEREHALIADKGKQFFPLKELPEKSRVVHKVPSLARAKPAELSKNEKELLRYLQVILPDEVPPADHLQAIQNWPGVEKADLSPDATLP